MPLGIALFELASKAWMTKSPVSRIQIYGILSHSFLVRNYIYSDAGIMISLLYAFALHSRQEDGRNKERAGGENEKRREKWHNDVIITIVAMETETCEQADGIHSEGAPTCCSLQALREREYF